MHHVTRRLKRADALLKMYGNELCVLTWQNTDTIVIANCGKELVSLAAVRSTRPETVEEAA